MGWLISALALLAAIGLGLTAGALLAEGAVLVPFWRSLTPEEFLTWYPRNASLLMRFFAPLEVIPVLFVLPAAGCSLYGGRPGAVLLALSGLCAIIVLLSFPLYFRSANQSFATGSIGTEKVSGELRRWSRWHWARTLVATLAFVSALLSLTTYR